MAIKTITKEPGRPTVMTEETVSKLKQAFLMGCDVTEACAYAEISRESYYSYCEKKPDFLTKVEDWRQNPILKAKATVYKNLDQTETAKWYLERKKKSEFAQRSEFTGAEGKELQPILVKFLNGKDDRDSK